MPTSSKMKSRSAESPLKFKTTNRNSLITRFPSHMSTVSRLSETIIVQGRCHWFGGIRLSSAHSTELLSMDLTVSQILEAMLSPTTERVESKLWKTPLLTSAEQAKRISSSSQTCPKLTCNLCLWTIISINQEPVAHLQSYPPNPFRH